MISLQRVNTCRRVTSTRHQESSALRSMAECANRRRNRHLFRNQWNVDDEDAALPGQVADEDVPPVCPDGLAGNREPQAEAGPITAAPVAERSERVARALRDATTLVFHLDQDAAALAAG